MASKGLVRTTEAGDGDHDITADEEAILLEANAYALASHFLWGVWAIVQSHISTIQFAYLVRASLCYDIFTGIRNRAAMS